MTTIPTQPMSASYALVPADTQALVPVEPARQTTALQPYTPPAHHYSYGYPLPPPPAAAPAEETLISLSDVIDWLRSYWKRGVMVALPVAALTFYLLGFGPKVYQAEAMLQVNIQDDSLLKLGKNSNNLTELSAPQIINNHRTGLKTRRFLDYLFDNIPHEEMDKMLGPAGVIGMKTKVLMALGIKGPPKEMTPQERFNKLTGETVRIEPVKESHVLRVIVEGGDPDLTASLANHYVKDYIEYVATDSVDDARSDYEKLTSKVADTKKLLDAAEQALADFSQKADLLRSKDANDLTTMRADSLEKALSDVEVELLRADERVRQVNDAINSGGDLASLKGPGDGSKVIEVQRKLIEAKSRRDKLLEYCGPRHPSLVNALAEIKGMEKEIRDNIVSAAESDQARLRNERERLTQALTSARGEAFGQSPARIQQKQLRDKADSLRSLYADLVQNQERARLASELHSSASLSVKDIAMPADDPVSPKKSIALVAAMMVFGLVGLGVPVTSGLGRDHLLPILRKASKEATTATTNTTAPAAASPFQQAPAPHYAPPAAAMAPAGPALQAPGPDAAIVASIPELMAGEGPVQLSELLHPNPLSGGNSMSQITALLERYRATRRTAGIVLLTSATVGEGKSMIASALADSLCTSGRSVFLIECNPAAPSVENWFPQAASCSSWSSDLETLRYGYSNLFMLPANDLPSYEMTDLLDGYRAWIARAQAQSIDWIILDGASLLHGFADVAQLAPMATDILFVHDSTRCDAEQVKAGLNLLRPLTSKDNMRGIVMNRQTTCAV
jgi:uncharacterized protein involved in exopolysaccharide biosynthesis/Mrp family chromosome partitioning ATPase